MTPSTEKVTLPLGASDWPLARAALLTIIGWLTLGWPWLSGRVTIPWDAKAQFLPQVQFLAQSVARGESPFWLPFAFSGHPQAADPQSMIFSPPFLLLALFDPDPGSRTFDLTVMASVLAGMLAIILFFRDNRWHWTGAVIAALAFGFGASMAWRIQHVGQVLSLVYLSITLLLLRRALMNASAAYGAAAGAVAAFMVLGRDQVALLGVYLLIGYVIWHWVAGTHAGEDARSTRTGRFRESLAPLIAGGVVGVLVIALPVLMTALVAETSNRPHIDLVGAGRGSLHPSLLITLFAPDLFGSSGRMEDYWGPPSFAWSDTGLYIAQNMGQLYIGAIPALMLLIGIASGAVLRAEIRFFTLALALMLLYALGWYTPFFRFAHALLPGIDLYRRPADATFLIGYLSAILSGYVTHRFFVDPDHAMPRTALKVTAMVVVASFVTGAVLAMRFDRVGQAASPFLVSLAIVAGGAGAIFLAWRIEPLRPVAAAAILMAFTVADLAWSNGPGSATALPSSYYDVLEPNTRNETIAELRRRVSESASGVRRDRVELIGLGFHWPNASLTHRLENTLGYNPVRLAIYSKAAGAGDTSGAPGDRKFSALMPSYRSTLADLLGLRFIASGVPIEGIDPKLKPGDLEFVARTPDAYIYENARALPRVLYVPSARSADFNRLVESGGLDIDPREVVLLEGTVPLQASSYGSGTAAVESYTNTEVVINAEGADGGWVVLNDIWHPWWTVTVDGEPTRLLRANVLFRAAYVAPGRHRIVFTFQPILGALRDAYKRLQLQLGDGQDVSRIGEPPARPSNSPSAMQQPR